MSVDGPGEDNVVIPEAAAFVDQSEAWAEFAAAALDHRAGLIEHSDDLGVEIDGQGLFTLHDIATRLARIEHEAGEDAPRQKKRLIMELMAIGEMTPLGIEAVIRYSEAPRLTDEDQPELDRVIAETRLRTERETTIAMDLADLMTAAGIVLSPSNLRELEYLNMVISRCYGLRFNTEAADYQRVQMNHKEYLRIMGNGLNLSPNLIDIAIRMLNS
jgi:hypothetical protein